MHHPSQLLFKRRARRLEAGSCLLNARLKEGLTWLKPCPVILVHRIICCHCDIGRRLICASHFRQGVCTAVIRASLRCDRVDRVHHEAGVDLPVGADEALDVRLAVKGRLAHDLAAYHRQGVSDLPKIVERLSHVYTCIPVCILMVRTSSASALRTSTRINSLTASLLSKGMRALSSSKASLSTWATMPRISCLLTSVIS